MIKNVAAAITMNKLPVLQSASATHTARNFTQTAGAIQV
jgi:hypothetical protein